MVQNKQLINNFWADFEKNAKQLLGRSPKIELFIKKECIDTPQYRKNFHLLTTPHILTQAPSTIEFLTWIKFWNF